MIVSAAVPPTQAFDDHRHVNRAQLALGERIAARDPDRQAAEIHIRVALTNHFNALGTAEIVRVA